MSPKSKNTKLKDDEHVPISQQQEEEMSSAFIARLLAEENADEEIHPYYAEYSNETGTYEQYMEGGEDDCEDDDDNYTPKRGKIGKKIAARTKYKKRKLNPSLNSSHILESTSAESSSNQDGSSSKKRKERRPPIEGYNTGVYTDAEEERFLTGLELHGRDWGKLVEYIHTRDANSIRSHAQKHFIKLYRDGLPLPDKVKASGLGYTLSGKELDPNSAAARPYLGKLGLPSPMPAKESENKDKKCEGVDEILEKSEPIKSAFQKKEPKGKKPRLRKEVTKDWDGEESIPGVSYGEDGRTEYTKSRLRQNRERVSVSWSQLGSDANPLTMVKCEPFCGSPGSGVSGSQPFSISVVSNVLVAMDFHAHLMSTEVIGFLAGLWDIHAKTISIKSAHPCRSLPTGQDHTNVEMDPTSALEVRQSIVDQNLQVVGWYHSHPTFIPDPSLIDIHNQTNYQRLCKHPETGEEPFVGAIIGPYDPHLPGSTSVINWFYVSDSSEDQGRPKRLTYEMVESKGIGKPESERMLDLLTEYGPSSERVNFSDTWRRDCNETKLQKFVKSLAKRMPWLHIKEQDGDDKENLGAEQREGKQVADVFLQRIETALKTW